MAVTVAASRPRNTCDTILPTRRLSCQEPASRMQSRMRWTAQRRHAAPWKTSPSAWTSPGWASETTSRWIGNTYLDDSGRDSPASLNSTGDM